MIYKLTIAQRMVASSLLRTKKGGTVEELMEWNSRSREVDISPDERIAIGFRVQNGVPAYQDTEPPKEYDIELKDEEVTHMIASISDLVERGKVTAGNENILSLYGKLTGKS